MKSNPQKLLSGALLPAAMIVSAFLISIAVYFFSKPTLQGRIFLYPTNSGVETGAEKRSIPTRLDLIQQIEVFLQELFLGPITLELTRIVPPGTKIKHTALIGRDIYIDLNDIMLDADSTFTISFDAALSFIRKNIQYNFPRLKEIVFTIEGIQVGSRSDYSEKSNKL